MYYYVIAFFSTFFLTTIITKLIYLQRDEPKVNDKPKLQETAKSKPLLQFSPKGAIIDPVKLPILSQEKHDEYMRLSSQWTSLMPTPESKDIYSETLSAQTCLFCIRKSVSMGEWAAFEREHTSANIGTWIPIRETSLLNKDCINVLFAILRVDRPEKWERHTYFYLQCEKVPRQDISILSDDSTKQTSIDAHDAAMLKRQFPEREYIYSPSILPTERVPSYRVKAIDEWRDYERKYANAPIGSWIHFDDPQVFGSSTLRVSFAILRIDAPERWEEHVYLYHKGESLPKA